MKRFDHDPAVADKAAELGDRLERDLEREKPRRRVVRLTCEDHYARAVVGAGVACVADPTEDGQP